MRIHELKTWPAYFRAIRDGDKAFEVRENDRAFAMGDLLVLREYDPSRSIYTGEAVCAVVTYLMGGGTFGITDTHCVMSIKVIWLGDYQVP